MFVSVWVFEPVAGPAKLCVSDSERENDTDRVKVRVGLSVQEWLIVGRKVLLGVPNVSVVVG